MVTGTAHPNAKTAAWMTRIAIPTQLLTDMLASRPERKTAVSAITTRRVEPGVPKREGAQEEDELEVKQAVGNPGQDSSLHGAASGATGDAHHFSRGHGWRKKRGD
jgi:hypothetical protein